MSSISYAIPLQVLLVFSPPLHPNALVRHNCIASSLSLSLRPPRELKSRRSLAASLLRVPPQAAKSIIKKVAMASIALPDNFGLVILTIVASGILVQWQAFQVVKARGMYKVSYPKMYEDSDKSVFNCFQRAHQNTLESLPLFLTLLLVAGLGFPITSSICGLVWIAGRVVYSLGYYTGNPKNRMRGMWNMFGLLGLAVTCVVFALNHVTFPKLG